MRPQQLMLQPARKVRQGGIAAAINNKVSTTESTKSYEGRPGPMKELVTLHDLRGCEVSLASNFAAALGIAIG